MKKFLSLIFVAAVMLVCVIPFAGTAVFKSDEAIGNEQKTEFPKLFTDTGFNFDFFKELGGYFEASFAFRPQVISADAEIQSQAFGVSNLDSVIAGKSGWLFYSSSLDDYLGENTLSQRSIKNIARNLKLTQDYVQRRGAEFIFTVAPNKNTLYPDFMPYYYSVKSSPFRNADFLGSELAAAKVNYCDLFAAFKNEDEILYLKRDSHWNNKGALLAYNSILDSLGKPHNDYSSAEAVREKTFVGDLDKMLRPALSHPEYNYEYDIQPTYNYVTPTKSVEEAVIKTENPGAQGSLYMYRDSFGNSLLPLFADAYGSAYFTKAFPVNLAAELELNQPDTVVIELVERNIGWLESRPPVFEAPEIREYSVSGKADGNAEITAKDSEVNPQYIELSGFVDSSLCGDDTGIYAEVADKSGKKRLYQAFCMEQDDGKSGFLIYLPKSGYSGYTAEASVIISNGGGYSSVMTGNIVL
ncbi:MAG: hypothetical protein IIZ36_04375 [Ruminococcus sp.]|nr:hypothetical protein [Ruminococcus sp.]